MNGCGTSESLGIFLIGALVWINGVSNLMDWGTLAGIILMLIGTWVFYKSDDYKPKIEPKKKKK